MQMLPIAMLMLFSGQDLEGWITIAGQWDVVDQAITCVETPATIRSSYESDACELTFQYRRADKGTNRVFLHSKMTTGGTGLYLTPAGVSDKPQPQGKTVDADEWITVKLSVTDDKSPHLKVLSSGVNDQLLSEFTQPLAKADRGFIRFEASKPSLQIRSINAAEPRYARLFDDHSLDGWEPVRPRDYDVAGWVNENGIVRCRSRRSNWLRTLRTYDDFVLRLEFYMPPAGNSGIFVRAPIEGRCSREGFEVQLLDNDAFRGQINPASYTGAIYDGVAPEVEVPCPANQWNSIEISAVGKQIRTTVNGVQIYDVDLNDASKDINSHKRPLATRRSVGFIGLQDHEHPVRFRNVRIRDLDLEKR